ncbi:hypothetical protein CARUB_v10007102mg [Capsella rubella]|uniref:RING-type domain-containing protein n=1 Tax=Capsella rubella TaxID=81985 RepID=R0H1Q4_9BRAS|nr:hypothetical protein CARUB_v10007102mg [Capsella rubella]
MERQTLTIEINSWVSNLPINKESKNVVKIYPHEKLEETIIEDESGIVTLLDSPKTLHEPNSHIRLFPRSFTPSHLSQLLRVKQVTCYISELIAFRVNQSFDNDVSLREPVFVTVNVKFVLEIRYMILSPVVSVPRGASAEVLQRLSEEQRVEPTCSICIENLSGCIIRMPRCLHMFHQECLFEWLGRQNSCPLCRRVPYEEEETQTLA